jgi:hypothetical protein
MPGCLLGGGDPLAVRLRRSALSGARRHDLAIPASPCGGRTIFSAAGTGRDGTPASWDLPLHVLYNILTLV